MDVNKQSQQAGEGSQLVQAGTIIINQGISEERVRAIFNEMMPIALERLTKEGIATASARVEKLGNIMLPRVESVEGMLEAFANPTFLRLLRKAQQAAAITEEEADYKLLTELLVCHVEKEADRKNMADISRAIEIVGEIDNSALCGLTIMHAMGVYAPTSGNLDKGLQDLDEMYGKLEYVKLPEGEEWIDHLDVLRTIRISQVGGFKKFEEYCASFFDGYSCVGIKIDSNDYQKAKELLTKIGIDETKMLVKNDLLDGYCRLPISSRDQITKLKVREENLKRTVTEQERKILEDIWRLYEKNDDLQKYVEKKFVNKWDTYEKLRNIHIWWNLISTGFRITGIGKMLAHTNEKRCDSDLPDLV